jgi:hypothetical protein
VVAIKIGEIQCKKALEVCVSVTLDANETAEGGSVCNSHDCLDWPFVVLIDDDVYMVAGHGASIANEDKHLRRWQPVSSAARWL